MQKQKICIIGGGLAGLTTASTLKKLNFNIDLFCGKSIKSFRQDKRVTAISESNYQFLKEITDLKNYKYFWPSKKIKLFYESKNKYLNFLNFKNKNSFLMYVFENFKFSKHLISELKKYKNINFSEKSIEDINYNNSFIRLDKKKRYYDLIILCTGNNNNLYKDIINEDRSIIRDYKEFAITGLIKHNFKINGSSQYFFKDGPFAILPFKKNMFSFVWSAPKSLLKNDIKILIRKKLNLVFGNKNKMKILEIQSFPLYLNLKNQYFKKNTLILGQGIHSIHPIAGQGFNLVLRDIKKLALLIERNLNLGLPIKDSYILKEFYNSRNPENTMFGLGNDLIHNFFKGNKFTDPIKDILLKNISKYEGFKKISKSISDKGFFI